MPVAHINVLRGHSRSQLRQLIVEASDTVARILEAPKDRLEIWITEIDPELWGVCGVPASEALQEGPLGQIEMPFIRMVIMEGRTQEQRFALMAELTEVVARTLGTDKERIRFQLTQIQPDGWGIGGVPASIRRAAEIEARRLAAQSAAPSAA
jgi:4-oxalocrotonate tautomerase family enzyme